MGMRPLGRVGLRVSELGLGCAGMSSIYGASDDRESMATLIRAVELGITFFDTADVYGEGHNERLIGKAFAGRRDQVTIATKFGFRRDNDGRLYVDVRPAGIRASCEASLRRLGIETVDLYYPHRLDPAIPVEDVVGAMAQLVGAGMVRYLGLCEVSSRTLERAARVYPISALESEWSLWTRDIETTVRPAALRLGVGIVPYSPLGRGFLAGTISSPDTLGPADYRRTNPRFEADHMARNMRLVTGLRTLAAEKRCTVAQLSLAWVLTQGGDVVPIPGTKRRAYLEENAAAARIELTEGDLARIEAIVPYGVASGERYAGGRSYTDTPLPGLPLALPGHTVPSRDICAMRSPDMPRSSP
jgi:aryl-alcohol dehydrogenase-like predicted oxidoreductase